MLEWYPPIKQPIEVYYIIQWIGSRDIWQETLTFHVKSFLQSDGFPVDFPPIHPWFQWFPFNHPDPAALRALFNAARLCFGRSLRPLAMQRHNVGSELPPAMRAGLWARRRRWGPMGADGGYHESCHRRPRSKLVVSLWKPKKTKKPGLDEFERPKIDNHLRLPDCHFRNWQSD